MSHYDLTVWTDYARGLLPAGKAAEMTTHLEECLLCGYLANLLRRAAEAGRADRHFEPPAAQVAAAEAIFPGSASLEPGSFWAGLRRLAGSVHWDSMQSPAQAGVRSMRSESRHVTYRAGRYSVNLWLDSDPATEAILVIGQIADEAAPETLMGDLRAVLLAGQRPVASTTTTEFGEFSLSCKPAANLRLMMPIERTGEYVDVPLGRPDGR